MTQHQIADEITDEQRDALREAARALITAVNMSNARPRDINQVLAELEPYPDFIVSIKAT